MHAEETGRGEGIQRWFNDIQRPCCSSIFKHTKAATFAFFSMSGWGERHKQRAGRTGGGGVPTPTAVATRVAHSPTFPYTQIHGCTPLRGWSVGEVSATADFSAF